MTDWLPPHTQPSAASETAALPSLVDESSLCVCFCVLVLDVCPREMQEMASRLHLNLGLVYDCQEDLERAREFFEKALTILKLAAIFTH